MKQHEKTGERHRLDRLDYGCAGVPASPSAAVCWLRISAATSSYSPRLVHIS